jgi:hypothetical protein
VVLSTAVLRYVGAVLIGLTVGALAQSPLIAGLAACAVSLLLTLLHRD